MQCGSYADAPLLSSLSWSRDNRRDCFESSRWVDASRQFSDFQRTGQQCLMPVFANFQGSCTGQKVENPTVSFFEQKWTVRTKSLSLVTSNIHAALLLILKAQTYIGPVLEMTRSKGATLRDGTARRFCVFPRTHGHKGSPFLETKLAGAIIICANCNAVQRIGMKSIHYTPEVMT